MMLVRSDSTCDILTPGLSKEEVLAHFSRQLPPEDPKQTQEEEGGGTQITSFNFKPQKKQNK